MFYYKLLRRHELQDIFYLSLPPDEEEWFKIIELHLTSEKNCTVSYLVKDNPFSYSKCSNIFSVIFLLLWLFERTSCIIYSNHVKIFYRNQNSLVPVSKQCHRITNIHPTVSDRWLLKLDFVKTTFFII